MFHSEADFQHALAWAIHQSLPDARVRLEFRPSWLSSRTYLDIWVEHEGRALALELKYKTRRLRESVGGEVFDLLDQSAQDIGRYDFLKDLQRLEAVVASRPDTTGCAIGMERSRITFPRP